MVMAQKRLSPVEMTLRQLRKVASELGISRYSRMRKSELLREVLEAQDTRNLSSTLLSELEVQREAKAKKFELGQEKNIDDFLSSIDQGLTDLPNEYRKSRIVLMPRDPEWAYAYWNIPNELKEELRRQGGQQLALRIYDVTDINLDYQSLHSIQEYSCDELANEWYIPISVSDRNYIVEIGYRCADGHWLVLARSEPVHIPPVYPSDWIEEQFITVSWDEDLHSKTFIELFPASRKITFNNNADDIGEKISGIAEVEDQRVSSSIQMLPGLGQIVEQGVSSCAMASGMGIWESGRNVSRAPQVMSGVSLTSSGIDLTSSGVGLNSSGIGLTSSGVGLTSSGVGMSMSGLGLTSSGIGLTSSGIGLTSSGIGLTSSGVGMSMSGLGLTSSGVGMSMSGLGLTTSGVGMSMSSIAASMPPVRPRQFWLVADAELIIHGATEPDATVTIGGRPIKLNSDGTFRFQIAFPDSVIDYPIMAVAVDGEQNRSIYMKFTRQTPEHRTNTKKEAILEWMS